MEQVLIVYSKMIVGGSTTSLLSLLESFDYRRYSVDLLLYDDTGDLQGKIPPQVHILAPAKDSGRIWRKVLNPAFWADALRAKTLVKKHGKRLIQPQIMAKYEAKSGRRLPKHYDIGIGFLEFWPCEYLLYRVDAVRKIGWIHIDVKEAGLLPQLSEGVFRSLDTVVLVSEPCLHSFRETYPQFASKAAFIENILSSQAIRKLAQETSPVQPARGVLHLVSVCRIVFSHKGLDRGVAAFERLKREGRLKGVDWYVVGDGPDMSAMEDMICRAELQDHIFLIGKHLNPYCIEKEMDVFFLPSRYEGKPMAVTEAQMLGLVPVVSNYSSAKSQVRHQVDGIIMENNDQAPYETLRDLLDGKYDLPAMKAQVEKKDYSNLEEMQRFYQLIEPSARPNPTE